MIKVQAHIHNSLVDLGYGL